MVNSNLRLQEPEPDDETPADAWVPRIDTHDVLERMIAEELRAGRLTPARRARVLRYAAGMGLSAVQAGQMLERIRCEALHHAEPQVREFALRIAPPEKAGMSMRRRLVIGMVVTIVLQIILGRLIG